MPMKPLELSLGSIVETIFIENMLERDVEGLDELFYHLTDFCVDVKGRVRLNVGIIGSHDPDNMDFVPPDRYEITPSAWNSHQQYVDIELPNPAHDKAQYHLIRKAFMKELKRRMGEV